MSNKLTVTYKNTPIINEKEIEGDAVVSYKGSTVQTISAGEEVKLNTKDKYTSDFITIAGEKLNTAGKIIKDFINISVVTGWDPSAHHRVGGRIFYDNGGSNTYTFYTQDGTVITDTSISGLANAYYYDKSGSGADRFYVFNSNLQASRQWGKYGTSIGITRDGIGKGKTNTATALTQTGWESNSIFGYIIQCNNNSLSGCSDWFIASQAEQTKLRESGLVDWYSSNSIWSSVESDRDYAYYWRYAFSNWGFTVKGLNNACFAARSF